MTDFHEWFRRTTGRWTSERRYLLNLKTRKPTSLITEFTISACTEGEWDFIVEWKGKTEGAMNLKLLGNELNRDVGYYTSEPTTSLIEAVDSDTIVLSTEYSGMFFREEIRLLNNDSLRLRQTIGYDKRTGEVRLVGQYFEERI